MRESEPTTGIIGPYPPFRGGIAQFTSRFHRALHEAGHHAVGLSFKRQYPSILFPGKSQLHTSSTPEFESDRLIDSIGPWTWRRAANRLIEAGVDRAVVMHWMPFFAPAYGSIAARLQRVGISCSAIVHNALPHEKQPFAGPLTRRFMRHCDHIVALSETVRRDLVAMGVDANIDVRPHPTYDQFGAPVDKAAARDELGLDPDETVLLFFGLVRPYKGIDTLFDAMSRSTSRPRLVVAGEWYQDRGKAEAWLHERGLTDQVRLDDGYIEDERVALYFSAADAVVQPYRSATQSGVVQTAFHFGRPVIVTGVGGLPEVVRHERDALLVPPEDPDALATAIDRLADPTFLAALSQGALEARNRFSWEHFTEPFLSRP